MKTLTAEEVFQKWNDIYHSGSGSGNAHDHHIKAMEDYAAQFAQPPYGREVWEWVKCSDRLPSESGWYFVMCRNDKQLWTRSKLIARNEQCKLQGMENPDSWLCKTTIPEQVAENDFMSVLVENKNAKVKARAMNMPPMEIFETESIYDAVINEYNDLIEILKKRTTLPATHINGNMPFSENLQLEFNKLPDIRVLLLMHPDGEMIERSCLHFLGDAAQNWWENKDKATLPAPQGYTKSQMEDAHIVGYMKGRLADQDSESVYQDAVNYVASLSPAPEQGDAVV